MASNILFSMERNADSIAPRDWAGSKRAPEATDCLSVARMCRWTSMGPLWGAIVVGDGSNDVVPVFVVIEFGEEGAPWGLLWHTDGSCD